MIALHAKLDWRAKGQPFVARVTRNRDLPLAERASHLVLVEAADDVLGVEGYSAMASHDCVSSNQNVIGLPPSLSYLTEGDVVRLDPRLGTIRILYRQSSPNNHFLVTERCNSKCIMCSQPPREVDDEYLVDDLLKAMPLMNHQTKMIGITGGEATLIGNRLPQILACAKHHLPETHVFCLTNGRLLRYYKVAEKIAAVQHPSLIFCVPLYSDVDNLHDFVVQADGAFDQTVRGILNLARVGVPVEIRVVIHQQTYERLPQLAEFITRNFPFVTHVALMGLEITGFTKANIEALWIDPVEYKQQLSSACHSLQQAGIDVSIYNHQLCLLPQSLWELARKSISDWKNEYMPECDNCFQQDNCGGFFASAKVRYSRSITPFVSM